MTLLMRLPKFLLAFSAAQFNYKSAKHKPLFIYRITHELYV